MRGSRMALDYSLAMLRALIGFLGVLSLALVLAASETGSHAEYIGGAEPQVRTNCTGVLNAVDDVFFTFSAKQVQMRIPYERINLLEYGQKVNGRYVEAILISPLFLKSKKREH